MVSCVFDVAGLDYSNGEFCDYDEIADFIRTFSGKSIDTQEELTDTVCRFISEKKGVSNIRVYSKKPDVYPDAEYVGVCSYG
jgi:dihydroneopterin aldolase